MIRVLNIMGTLDRGGQETTVMHHYRHMDKTQVQFDFLLTDQPTKANSYEAEAQEMGARIFKRPLRSKDPVGNASALKKLLKVHREIQLVHIHNMTPLIAIDALIAKRCRVPVRIAHSRCDMPEMPFYQKAFRPLLRKTSTDWFACSQRAGASLFGDKCLHSKRFSLWPNARPLKQFTFDPILRQTMRQELNLTDNDFAIVNIGRLNDQKNQHFLLQCFARFYEHEKQAKLFMVGEGNLLESLQKKSQELGITQRVIFLGLRNDIPALLQAFDLFALPSLYEGLPGTAIEAQAADLPCLLSDTIAPESKLTEKLSFLPIDRGPAPWVDAFGHAKKQNVSRKDRFSDMEKAGYDIESAAKKMQDYYIQALKESNNLY